jgi:WD40 repeat protein
LSSSTPTTESYVAWSHDGRVLAATTNFAHVQVWDIPSGNRTAGYHVGFANPMMLALSPDGKVLAATDFSHVELREASSGQVLGRFAVTAAARSFNVLDFLAWSPDGKLLAACCDKGVALCDPASMEIVKTLPGPAGSLAGIAWSADGRSLVCAPGRERPLNREEVFVWDVPSGQLRRTLYPIIENLILVRWLSDGRTVAVANRDKTVLINADSGQIVRTVDTSADDVSGDGRLAFLGGAAYIRTLSLADGRSLLTLLCLRDGQFALISPEGHFRGTPGVEKELVYVVQTDAGPETLTPDEFAQRYGWKNDPEKVHPVGETKAEGGTPTPAEKAKTPAAEQAISPKPSEPPTNAQQPIRIGPEPA